MAEEGQMEQTEEQEDEEEIDEEEDEIESLGIAESLKGDVGTIEPQISPAELPLEELAEAPEQEAITEADNFSEFMFSPSQEMPTSTLPSAETPISEPVSEAPESLEGIDAADSIGTAPPTQAIQGEEQYVSVYNEPDYTAGTSEETIFERMQERGMAARSAEQARSVQPRTVIEEWHETGAPRQERGGDNIRDYVAVEEGRRADVERRNLPFQERIKYKELKRGRAR